MERQHVLAAMLLLLAALSSAEQFSARKDGVAISSAETLPPTPAVLKPDKSCMVSGISDCWLFLKIQYGSMSSEITEEKPKKKKKEGSFDWVNLKVSTRSLMFYEAEQGKGKADFTSRKKIGEVDLDALQLKCGKGQNACMLEQAQADKPLNKSIAGLSTYKDIVKKMNETQVQQQYCFFLQVDMDLIKMVHANGQNKYHIICFQDLDSMAKFSVMLKFVYKKALATREAFAERKITKHIVQFFMKTGYHHAWPTNHEMGKHHLTITEEGMSVYSDSKNTASQVAGVDYEEMEKCDISYDVAVPVNTPPATSCCFVLAIHRPLPKEMYFCSDETDEDACKDDIGRVMKDILSFEASDTKPWTCPSSPKDLPFDITDLVSQRRNATAAAMARAAANAAASANGNGAGGANGRKGAKSASSSSSSSSSSKSSSSQNSAMMYKGKTATADANQDNGECVDKEMDLVKEGLDQLFPTNGKIAPTTMMDALDNVACELKLVDCECGEKAENITTMMAAVLDKQMTQEESAKIMSSINKMDTRQLSLLIQNIEALQQSVTAGCDSMSSDMQQQITEQITTLLKIVSSIQSVYDPRGEIKMMLAKEKKKEAEQSQEFDYEGTEYYPKPQKKSYKVKSLGDHYESSKASYLSSKAKAAGYTTGSASASKVAKKQDSSECGKRLNSLVSALKNLRADKKANPDASSAGGENPANMTYDALPTEDIYIVDKDCGEVPPEQFNECQEQQQQQQQSQQQQDSVDDGQQDVSAQSDQPEGTMAEPRFKATARKLAKFSRQNGLTAAAA